jgi:ferredoxin-NADP reductase
MLNLIDRALDSITMYRLVLYYLLSLVVAAFVFTLFGQLPYQPLDLAFSSLLIAAVCWLVNIVFAWGFDAAANKESVWITALILILIVDPVSPLDPAAFGIAAFAAVWAIASKFILAVGRRHIFNPAAFGVALTALALGTPASWWVGGNLQLAPIVLVGGLLVVRKLRRFDLVAAFTVVVLGTIAVANPSQPLNAMLQALEYTPLMFFAFVMLTEPLTMPNGRLRRVIFAAFVGLLFSPAIHFGSAIITPEQAILAGNLLAFAFHPRGRAMLKLQSIREAAADVFDFVFSADRQLAFQAGQYIETTLPTVFSDNRGNRRYFTIASAPSEREIVLGVKFYNAPSTFKQALAKLKPGDSLLASLADGGFTLPRRKRAKLAFLAGGIGVTPFRSMIRELIDRGERRDIVMFYANERAADIAYRDTFERAERDLGIRTVYTLAKAGPQPGFHNGLIDRRLIETEMPDWRERIFYISGPRKMVSAYERLLREMGVPRRRIRLDFFPGFA